MENKSISSPALLDVVLSLNSSEWFYGRKKIIDDPNQKLLMKGYIPSEAFISPQYATEINEYYCYIIGHEHDTAKRKARPFYIDKAFLVNGDYHWFQ